MLLRRREGEGLEAPERAEGRALMGNPYPASPGKFPQAAALGPKVCQLPLLETETISQRMASPKVASGKREGWVAKDLLSALREDLFKEGSRHTSVHARMCVYVPTCVQETPISTVLQTQRLACGRENKSPLWARPLSWERGRFAIGHLVEGDTPFRK